MRTCRVLRGVGAELPPCALSSCEMAQLPPLGPTEPPLNCFSGTFLFRWPRIQTGEKRADKVKKYALQSLQVSSEWSVAPRTKVHTKLQGQHLPAELKGWVGCWAPGGALRTGWARLSCEIPALSYDRWRHLNVRLWRLSSA